MYPNFGSPHTFILLQICRYHRLTASRIVVSFKGIKPLQPTIIRHSKFHLFCLEDLNVSNTLPTRLSLVFGIYLKPRTADLSCISKLTSKLSRAPIEEAVEEGKGQRIPCMAERLPSSFKSRNIWTSVFPSTSELTKVSQNTHRSISYPSTSGRTCGGR